MALRATFQCPSRSPSLHSRSQPVQPRNLGPKQRYAHTSKNTLHLSESLRTAAAYTTHVQSASSKIKPLKERITPPMEWNKELKQRAENLIFGSRHYPDFSIEEKNIVDFYQSKILEIDGGVILPNTQAEIEQQEVNKILRQSQLSKK